MTGSLPQGCDTFDSGSEWVVFGGLLFCRVVSLYVFATPLVLLPYLEGNLPSLTF